MSREKETFVKWMVEVFLIQSDAEEDFTEVDNGFEEARLFADFANSLNESTCTGVHRRF